MRQVFISYSSKEADQANEIVALLEKQGIQCWIAPRDIRVGSNYTKDIPSAIKECPCFLLVLSKNAQNSKWVNKELTRAINQEKRIMPLMIEDFTVSEGFEFLLEDVQTRPYYRTKDQTMREVMEEIRVLLPQAVTAPKPAPASKSTEPSSEECFQKGEKAFYSKNYEEAVKWYRKAAEQGHSVAQLNLGYCYEFAKGLPLDYANAAIWYRKAAEQGQAGAQKCLGYCYEAGIGVPQNYEAAVMWYQKAAEQGHTSAQYNLGICYRNGNGVPQDYELAASWYRKAAEQGHAKAQTNLGYCYEKGFGVRKNMKNAVEWYRKGAENGDRQGQFNLALCYEYGRGVKKDLTEAKKWYQKAADQGDEKAKKALERLK